LHTVRTTQQVFTDFLLDLLLLVQLDVIVAQFYSSVPNVVLAMGHASG
jgi:hypothetical protein